jgi:hypothetical protein
MRVCSLFFVFSFLVDRSMCAERAVSLFYKRGNEDFLIFHTPQICDYFAPFLHPPFSPPLILKVSNGRGMRHACSGSVDSSGDG